MSCLLSSTSGSIKMPMDLETMQQDLNLMLALAFQGHLPSTASVASMEMGMESLMIMMHSQRTLVDLPMLMVMAMMTSKMGVC
jgi:hypothetical protein